mgnify:CR=1 FL=1
MEFELKDLERDNQKAELNVKSGEYDYKNSINKSDEAQQKQNDAKSKVSSLEQQVKDKQNYLASLKSQLASVQAQAAADAQAQAQAETQQSRCSGSPGGRNPESICGSAYYISE